MDKFINISTQPHKMLVTELNGVKADSPEQYGEFAYWDHRSNHEDRGGWLAAPLEGVEYPLVKAVWETQLPSGAIKKFDCPRFKVV